MPPKLVRIPGTKKLRDGEARKVLVPRESGPPLELLLVRKNGVLYALDSLCPHEGGRLAEGPLMDGENVTCPLHLYRFDPCTGEPVEVECERVRTFAVREHEGAAEIEVE
jgi:nitrite reductase/ring-hydroxylating ferredoxin subunit